MPQDRAPIPLKTIKLLFAQSGNRCAFPGCTEKLTYNDDTVLAEICHIQGYSPDSSRYNPAMTDKERNSLQNLVLMCAKHHTIIDTHPDEYTKERLWGIKKQHKAAIDAEKTSTGSLIPHQIPPPPADFTGRNDELTTLLHAHQDGACISGLKGIGGIGKSALAFALAEKLTPHYPDGQLMLDMLGTSQTPLSYVDAMRRVIQTLLPQDRLPENDTELKNLYLSVLHDKKLILLLDNARSHAQVEPLIPPKTCFLLITSRWHFLLPGLKSLDLEALPPASAIDLLLSIEPRLESPSPFQGEGTGVRVAPTSGGTEVLEPSAAAHLASLCEYLPLALRLTASALAEKPATSVAKFLAQFQDTQSRLKLTGMDASLHLSYDLLLEDLQEKLRFLSVFPAPFDSSAAMAIWDQDEETAETYLNSLVNASLLNFGETTGFSLHDLVRAFASNLLTPAESYTAPYRHSAHYLEVARHANALNYLGRDHILEGLRLFDAQWPHIRLGQAWAASTSETDSAAMNLCNEYPDAIHQIQALRLHPEQLIAWLQSALAAARRLEDKKYQGAHLGNLGNAYRQLDHVDKAIEHYQQALAIAREIGDRSDEGIWLGNLGLAYADLGQVEQAIEHYQQALLITREIGDRYIEGSWLGSLGTAYNSLGQVEKAIDYYQQALLIARETGDRRLEGNHLGNLGNAYYALGQVDKAIEHYQQALAIAREIGDRRGEGRHLGNLGNAYRQLGQVDKAIEHYQQALAIAREIGGRRTEGNHLGNLGNAYYSLAQVDKAIEHYQQALAIAREIGDRLGEGANLGNLGLAYKNLGQMDKAIEHYQHALAIAREIGDRLGEGNHLGNLGSAYYSLGQVVKAIDHYQQALAIAREIGDRRTEGNQLGNLANVYEEQGNLTRAVPLMAAALSIFIEIKSPFKDQASRLLDNLRQRMGDAAFTAALSQPPDP